MCARLLAVLTLLSVVAVSCDADPVPGGGQGDAAAEAGPCRDRDGDGHQDLDCGGDDCDDTDPEVAALAECFTDCDAEPHGLRCPCGAIEEESCYSGPADTVGVGPCAGGTRQCVLGAWTACEGERLPEWDGCNGLDDDCDGEVDDDEPPSRWCGCDRGCNAQCAGRDCPEPLSLEAARDVVPAEAEAGCLTLPPDGTFGTVETIFQASGTSAWHELNAWAHTPPGTTVRLELRASTTLSGLTEATWQPIGTLPDESPPYDVPYDQVWNEWLAVRAVLESTGETSPVLCALAAIPQPPGE